MNIADKLTAIAENEQKVYEAGKEKAISDFWDSAQDGVTRSAYMFASQLWNDYTFNPKKDIIVGGDGTAMFSYSRIVDLKGILERNGVSLIITPETKKLQSMFSYSLCENIPDIDLRGFANIDINTQYTFSDSKIKNMKLIVDENVIISPYAFVRANNLQNITFEGVIANTLRLHFSKLLSIESCKNIITNLKDYSGTDKEFTCELALTGEVKEMIKNDYTAPGGISWYEYATNKGWTV